MSSAEPAPSDAEAAPAVLRDTVLDAVGVLVADRGWSGTTVADVARGAGVSRQTVYHGFGSREALAQAFVLREVDRFLVDVEASVRAHGHDPAAAVGAGLRTFLVSAVENLVVKAVVGGEEGDGLLPLLTTAGGPVTAAAVSRLDAVFTELWPWARDADHLADVLVRLAISHAALPGGAPETVAADLARVLEPSVRRVFGHVTTS